MGAGEAPGGTEWDGTLVPPVRGAGRPGSASVLEQTNRPTASEARHSQQRTMLLVGVVHVEQGEVVSVDVGKAGLGLVRRLHRLARPREDVGNRQHGGDAAEGKVRRSGAGWG